MNYATIKKNDIANGTGVRVSLFVSGCRHRCKNCFNYEAWDFNYGKPFDDSVIEEILCLSDHQYIEGLSVLGGEPFEPENREGLLKLLKLYKKRFPNKNIWCYTGFTFDELCDKNNKNYGLIKDILSHIDVLVDGKFVEELKNLSLMFRGSENQNIIDVKKSLKEERMVLLEGNWTKKMGSNNIYDN